MKEGSELISKRTRSLRAAGCEGWSWAARKSAVLIALQQWLPRWSGLRPSRATPSVRRSSGAFEEEIEVTVLYRSIYETFADHFLIDVHEDWTIGGT